jgi:cephalosporin hydroxylase
MALGVAQPHFITDLLEHYAHLLICAELVDTRDHLPLFHSLPGAVLEIGCDCGNSTTAFLAGVASSVTSIDLNPLCAANFPDSPRWRFILGDSQQEETFAKVCNHEYDVLYIDGCHTYEATLHDLMTYSKLVRPGGLVLVHDVLANDNFPGVWRAFSDFVPVLDVGYKPVPFRTVRAKYIRPGSYGLGVIEL